MCKCLSVKILKQLNNQTIKQSIITQTIKQSDNQAINKSLRAEVTFYSVKNYANFRQLTSPFR